MSVLDDLGDLAGLDATKKKKVVVKKKAPLSKATVKAMAKPAVKKIVVKPAAKAAVKPAAKKVVKKKTAVKPLIPAKQAVTMTKAAREKLRIAKLKGKAVSKEVKAKKATGACGTFDIGCKVEGAAGKAGKYLAILLGVIAVALVGKSYLEKRAVQRIYEPAQSAYQPISRQMYENPTSFRKLSGLNARYSHAHYKG